jgi:hypothetical protein
VSGIESWNLFSGILVLYCVKKTGALRKAGITGREKRSKDLFSKFFS